MTVYSLTQLEELLERHGGNVEANCELVSVAIESELGLEQVHGVFCDLDGEVEHYWNLAEDGQIVDATGAQFEALGGHVPGCSPIFQLCPGEPDFLRYRIALS